MAETGTPIGGDTLAGLDPANRENFAQMIYFSINNLIRKMFKNKYLPPFGTAMVEVSTRLGPELKALLVDVVVIKVLADACVFNTLEAEDFLFVSLPPLQFSRLSTGL